MRSVPSTATRLPCRWHPARRRDRFARQRSRSPTLSRRRDSRLAAGRGSAQLHRAGPLPLRHRRHRSPGAVRGRPRPGRRSPERFVRRQRARAVLVPGARRRDLLHRRRLRASADLSPPRSPIPSTSEPLPGSSASTTPRTSLTPSATPSPTRPRSIQQAHGVERPPLSRLASTVPSASRGGPGDGFVDRAGGTGDPGRVHAEGLWCTTPSRGRERSVAELLGTTANRIVFTSGGTEAANAAIFAAGGARRGAPIICADVEHSCVREAARRSAEICRLEVDSNGRIDLEHLSALLAGARDAVHGRGGGAGAEASAPAPTTRGRRW